MTKSVEYFAKLSKSYELFNGRLSKDRGEECYSLIVNQLSPSNNEPLVS